MEVRQKNYEDMITVRKVNLYSREMYNVPWQYQLANYMTTIFRSTFHFRALVIKCL